MIKSCLSSVSLVKGVRLFHFLFHK